MSMPNTSQNASIESLFENLWQDYTQFNPRARRIYDLILRHEQEKKPAIKSLVNDHIALRTFNLPKVGLSALAAIFERHGYKEGGEYHFKEKKLFARHYEHENKRLPKVFISELLTEQCSPLVQKAAEEAVSAIDEDRPRRDDFLWSRRPWPATFATYQQLLDESEYAAWTYAFGYRANHFTISVNDLESFSGLEDLNDFVQANGYELNAAGGVIKGTPEQLLEQSSTLAEKTQLQFDDGVHEIPACYYEFARRYPKPNDPDGNLYTGFIAASADKIFESTNVRR